MKQTTNSIRQCSHCNKPYSKKQIESAYGKESMVAILGYCSSRCYTEATAETAISNEGLEDKRNRTKWEVWEDYDDNKEPCFSIRGNGGSFIVCKSFKNENEPPASKIALDNINFICEAVNNYSKLQSVNKELVEVLQNLVNLSYPSARPTKSEKEFNFDRAIEVLKKAKQL